MSLFNVTENGLITVDSSGIQQSFIDAYKGALGGDINTEAGSIQGQLIQIDSSMLIYAQNQCALIANAFNVLTAKGTALDVVANFWGYYRKEGVATVVNCVCSGTEGVVIPKGSLVSDGDYEYSLLDDITIGSNGTALGQFQCTTKGAITVLSGTITEIVSTLTGWDTVVNNAMGITGYDTETDNSFRDRITQNWFNVRARGALGAIWDNMATVENVISVCCRENPTNASITIDGFTLLPHSIFVCVAGGDSTDIAKCIYNQKTIGANTNGDTSVSYYDSSTGLTNTYKIQRASQVNLTLTIEYTPKYITVADVEQKIKDAVMAYIANNPFKIGQTISGYGLSGALSDFEYANILSVKVNTVGSGSADTDYLTTTIGEIAVLQESNITCSEVS